MYEISGKMNRFWPCLNIVFFGRCCLFCPDDVFLVLMMRFLPGQEAGEGGAVPDRTWLCVGLSSGHRSFHPREKRPESPDDRGVFRK